MPEDDHKPVVHEALAAVIASLNGGDIEHCAAGDALHTIFENWTAIYAERGEDYDPETMSENLMGQFDQLIEVLNALRPHASQALSELLVESAKPGI